VAEVYFEAGRRRGLRAAGRPYRVSLGIVRQAQSNSVAISDGVRAAVARLNATTRARDPVVSDDAVFIRGAIGEVLTSLALAVLIVVAWWPVPGPVARHAGARWWPFRWRSLGTLAAIWAAGLFGQPDHAAGAAAGHRAGGRRRHRRAREHPAPPARGAGAARRAVLGTREVFFAVLATTATLVSVFVPISFLPSRPAGCSPSSAS
jgi:hydrophobic/amphiphilic exporter-1 (mainly G- bacteria), HAE1 family